MAEYIWLGSTGSDLRNMTKVLDARPESAEDCPVIVARVAACPDGSSPPEGAAEVYLKPRKIFRDPFRGGDHLLVLCDTFNPPQVGRPPGQAGGGDGEGIVCRARPSRSSGRM